MVLEPALTILFIFGFLFFAQLPSTQTAGSHPMLFSEQKIGPPYSP
ncbi:hypothetical protein AAHE18_14G040300 [Arachis hypogaea]